MLFYQTPVSQVITHVQSSLTGLTSKEATLRRKKYGPNDVRVKTTPWWKKLIEPFLDLFTLILAGAAIISFWQNEKLDGFIILTIIAISAIIFYVQRFSTERVLRTLNKKNVQSVTVLRSGQKVQTPSTNLVPGDIVIVGEGERVPADLRIMDATSLQLDESILTGESLPATKHSRAIGKKVPIYEQANMLFSGSFVVSGTGKGVVVATGNHTEFGTIATLSKDTDPKSPVQRKIDKLIARIIMILGAMAVVTFILALARGMEMADSLRFVIALAVSAVPEGLPIAISVVLVLGMRRMATKKALVQQMRAIETLGVTTTIATDKTGTLTENKLTVRDIWQPTVSATPDIALAHAVNLRTNLSDPLDKALADYAKKKRLLPEERLPADELPFDQKFAMSAAIWHSGASYEAYVKGSPEAILKYSKLSDVRLKKAEDALAELTSKGYRVIGLATLKSKQPHATFQELTKHRLTFQGFVAIADILRPEAAKAIKTALAAGISVRMITGDHAETAFQIGKSLGMVSSRDEVFDCRTLDKISDEKLLDIIQSTTVFARVIPEHKYRLLTLLKRRHITAMTGDGVNDVPALTGAHVGIAMGSGSHIAKNAGDIILLDDNFKTILDAIREGRVIISNIRRMLIYLLATNAGEALSMLGALIIGMRLPLEPVQILWVNLVTDTALVIPLGLEPAEKDVMKQKPKQPNAPIFSRTMIARIAISALVIASLTLATYAIFSPNGHAYAQTMAFAALVVSQWGNAFAVRSHTESAFARLRVINPSFYVGLGISMALQVLVFFGPLREALHVTQVDSWHLAVVSLIAFIAPIIISDTLKLITRKHNR